MENERENVQLRNIIIRDAYKERWIREKSLEKERERKSRQEIQNRSAARFSSSPFAINVLALEEISEYKRKFDKKSPKTHKNSKLKRKPPESKDQKFLTKLRKEVRLIENSNTHTDERKLEAALKEKQNFSLTHEFSAKPKQLSRESEGFSVPSRGEKTKLKPGNKSYLF